MTDIIINNHQNLAFSGTLQLAGEGDQVLLGTDGADIIAGGKGDDTIEGGKGNDLLIGGELRQLTNGANAGEYSADGAGADTFVFNFSLARTTGATYYFRPNEDGTGGDTPNINGNLSAWQNYMSQLEEWRKSMFDQYGADLDAANTGAALYTVKKTIGTLGNYDNSYTVGSDSLTIVDHDGTDMILQFGDSDTLQLNGLAGLTFEEFDLLFDVGLNAKGDTVLSWAGGSITVNGLAIANVSDFWEAGSADNWFA